MDQKTIDEWEAKTPPNIPERLHKKAENMDYAKIAAHISMDDLLEMEKEANVLEFGKALAKVPLNAGRWLGEGLVNTAIGGQGGLKSTNILDPLRKGMNAKTVPISDWNPLHGIKAVGKIEKTHADGPFKGMRSYENGQVAYENANPTIMDRVKSMPGYAWQSSKGARPTRGDYLLHRMAGQNNMEPGKMWEHLQKNPEAMKAFQAQMGNINKMSPMQLMRDKDHGAWARKYYGLKTAWNGMTWGFPAYDAVSSAMGKGNPEQTAPQNVGEVVGSNAGMLGAWSLGLGGALGVGALGGAAGKAIGKGVGSLWGAKKAPQYMKENFGSPPGPFPAQLPQTSLEYRNELLREQGIPM